MITRPDLSPWGRSSPPPSLSNTERPGHIFSHTKKEWECINNLYIIVKLGNLRGGIRGVVAPHSNPLPTSEHVLSLHPPHPHEVFYTLSALLSDGATTHGTRGRANIRVHKGEFGNRTLFIDPRRAVRGRSKGTEGDIGRYGWKGTLPQKNGLIHTIKDKPPFIFLRLSSTLSLGHLAASTFKWPGQYFFVGVGG